jgi:hypothetical protein
MKQENLNSHRFGKDIGSREAGEGGEGKCVSPSPPLRPSRDQRRSRKNPVDTKAHDE